MRVILSTLRVKHQGLMVYLILMDYLTCTKSDLLAEMLNTSQSMQSSFFFVPEYEERIQCFAFTFFDILAVTSIVTRKSC